MFVDHEEIDLQRAKQAWSMIYKDPDAWDRGEDAQNAAIMSAVLAREGWSPTSPLDIRPDGPLNDGTEVGVVFAIMQVVGALQRGIELRERELQATKDAYRRQRVAQNLRHAEWKRWDDYNKSRKWWQSRRYIGPEPIHFEDVGAL